MQIYQLQTEDDEETLGGTCYLLCTCGVRMSWNTIQLVHLCVIRPVIQCTISKLIPWNPLGSRPRCLHQVTYYAFAGRTKRRAQIKSVYPYLLYNVRETIPLESSVGYQLHISFSGLDPRDEWQRYHCCGSDRRMRAVPKSPDWAELCRLFLDSRTYLTGAIDLAICELLPPHLPRFLALSNSGLPSIRGPSRRPMTNTLCSSFMVEKRVPSLMTSPRSSV
ncbi:hypothetical protein J3A83DRAFT_3794309 [Scleroderma citrinum]